MVDTNLNMTLGAKAALKSPMANATITVTAKLSKPYIWVMKLRYIWAVIRAKVSA